MPGGRVEVVLSGRSELMRRRPAESSPVASQHVQDGCYETDKPGASASADLGPEGLQLQEQGRGQVTVGRGRCGARSAV